MQWNTTYNTAGPQKNNYAELKKPDTNEYSLISFNSVIFIQLFCNSENKSTVPWGVAMGG